MRKIYLLPILSLLVAIACNVIYVLSNPHVESDGLLVELFFLIPISWIFILIAIVSFTIINLVLWKKGLSKVLKIITFMMIALLILGIVVTLLRFLHIV